MHGQGLSEREVARRSDRDVSWVSRRLELACGLSDSVLAAVRQGALSTWTATRVLAPLARANSAQATQLLAALAATPLSTLELQTWFQHYLSTPRAARERMVSHPRLFIQSLRAQEEQRADNPFHIARQAAIFIQITFASHSRQRLSGMYSQCVKAKIDTSGLMPTA